MEVIIKPHLVSIKFLNKKSIIDVLRVLYFYINASECFIEQIVLISKKDQMTWYNDVTQYKNNSLIFLFFKIKSQQIEKKNKTSNITEYDLQNYAVLEIRTINEHNAAPTVVGRMVFLRLMYAE